MIRVRGRSQSKTTIFFSRPQLSEYVMEPELRAKCQEAAEQERADLGGRTKLHLVVLGHVDAGKSTLMGRLLHELG